MRSEAVDFVSQKTFFFGLAAMKVVIENKRLVNPFKDNTFHYFEVAQETVSMATEGYGKSSYSEVVASLLQTRFNMHADLLRRPSPASTG